MRQVRVGRRADPGDRAVTLETLMFLRRLLANQNLAVGDPTFPEVARLVLGALAELDEAIEAARPREAEAP